MTYDDANAVTQKEKRVARGLAIAIHVGFVVLLVFGISWQRRYTEPPVVVELWDSVTPPRQEKPVPKPLPKVELKPEPRPEPKPAPKPEIKPLPKPDIALKEKLEKERKVKEQQALEKKKEEEAKKLKAQFEAKKKDDEKKKLEQERLAHEAEARRAQEKLDLAKRLAAEQTAAQTRLVDEYKRRIHDRVRSFIVEPPGLQGNPEALFDIVVIPGGEVLTIKLRRSSGVPAYDAAVERAILKASPLPLPPDPALFQQFRDLNLAVRPKL